MVDLLRTHAEVLFQVNASGRITALNESDPETEAPRFFLALGLESRIILFRDDVPDEICQRLATAAESIGQWSSGRTDSELFDPLREIVAEWRSPESESHGPAFRFSQHIQEHPVTRVDSENSRLLDSHFPYTRSVLEERSPVFAVVREGAAVAAAYSARHTDKAAEVGVATVEHFRGQGLAMPVVEAWAKEVQAAGCTPLYSTSWSNDASLRVATKLGLLQYADTFAMV